jgi:predicted RNase H-like HicB family nuclease
MKYVYAALFTSCEEGGYAVNFPDLPGTNTQGDDLYEALYMAGVALKARYTSERRLFPIGRIASSRWSSQRRGIRLREGGSLPEAIQSFRFSWKIYTLTSINHFLCATMTRPLSSIP